MKAGKLSDNIAKRFILCAAGALMAFGISAGAGGTESGAAAKIPVSSAEDFKKIEDNPKGSYYLTKDITLKNMERMFPDLYGTDKFSGTLDGNGHKIKYIYTSSNMTEYTWVSMFGKASGATFKNLSLTGLKIDISAMDNPVTVAPLAVRPDKCNFENISVSGDITVRGNYTKSDKAPSYAVSGLIGGGTHTSNVKNCKSSVNINVKAELSTGMKVGGLALDLNTMEKCSFSGKITSSARVCGAYNDYLAAGLTLDAEKVNGCTNSGNVTITVKSGATKAYPGRIGAYGLVGGDIENVKTSVFSSKNTGNVKVNTTLGYEVRAAGVVDTVHSGYKPSITKCSNTGRVSASSKGSAHAAGIAVEASIVEQCYNTGTVTASGSAERAESQAGGLCGMTHKMTNCYNTGKISLKGSGCAGGLTANIDIGGVTTCNYATGKVTASGSKINAAVACTLFKYSVGTEEYMKNKSMVYNNYYTGSKKPYGYLSPDPSVKKRNPTAKKVSSITKKSCPKLSSKYWKYSSKHKRLILKNNKEK